MTTVQNASVDGSAPQRSARRPRALIAVVMAGVSAWVVVQGFGYGTGSMAQLGAGAFPVIVGALGLIAAILVLIESALDIGDARALLDHASRTAWLRIVGYVAVLCLFPLLIDRAGFVLAATLTGAGTARLAGQRSWWRCVVTAAVLAAVIHLGATRLLGVPLPGLPWEG